MTRANPETLFVDTNILIEATDVARSQHQCTRQLIEQATSWVMSAQIAREYLVVATRSPARNGLGMQLVDAMENLVLFRKCVRMLPEEKPVLPKMLELLREIPVTGRTIYDVNIVATMLVHGIHKLISINKEDFAPYLHKIVCFEPRSFVK